jgi:predicted PolB exonuclease-like 3'-5' exonuclease
MSYIPQNDIINSLFFDLETIPFKEFSQLSEKELELWKTVANKLRAKSLEYKEQTDEELWPMAGLYAEFGKIVCCSLGIFNDSNKKIYVKSFKQENEKDLIISFFHILDSFLKKNSYYQLAGFNIENFDIAFVLKRCLILGIPVQHLFNNYGKKPWDIRNLDLAKIWMGTGLQDRYMIKLDVLCYCLGVETPKSEVWGGSVWEYYRAGEVDKIAEYCDKDIVSTIKCGLKLASIDTQNIEIVKF